MPGVLWQGLSTLLAALAASWVSLLYRYRDGGRPFGSRRSRVRSLAIVTVTAAIATALGLGLPQAMDVVPPVIVGLLAPAFLARPRVGHPDSVGGGELLFNVVTIGLGMMLDRLEQQMAVDREEWCEARISETWSPDELDAAAWNVCTTLQRRIEDHGRLERLRSDYEAVGEAVEYANKVSDRRECRRALHNARQAYLTLLGRAYDWRHTDVKISRLRPVEDWDHSNGIGDRPEDVAVERPTPRWPLDTA